MALGVIALVLVIRVETFGNCRVTSLRLTVGEINASKLGGGEYEDGSGRCDGPVGPNRPLHPANITVANGDDGGFFHVLWVVFGELC